MKRLMTGFATAALLAGGLVVAQPTPVAAQNPTENCQACRVAFTTCTREVRSPVEAAACRAAALTCLQMHGCTAQ